MLQSPMPIYGITKELAFPPPRLAEDGLLAVGGDLSIDRLLLAYQNGIFPWYSEGEPILWWSPDPRMLLYTDQMHISTSLRRNLRRGVFYVTFDQAFPQVIRACAQTPRPGQDGTWITAEMLAAYIDLHHAGYAHSVECWQDGQLLGGLYGLSLGACFFGESMFSHASNASKTAMAILAAQCQQWGFPFIDCQVPNPHLASLGAQEIPRATFLKQLRKTQQTKTRKGPWQLEIDPQKIEI